MDKGFYTEQELIELGFSKVGKNVLISNKCSIYQAYNMEIGDNVRIDDFCVLIGKIILGNNIHIGAFCYLSGGAGIIMHDYSGLSQRCSLYTQSDDYSGKSMTNPTIPEKYKNIKSGKIVIGKHAIIGAACVILPDVSVGEGASVGAMSLVNKSLNAWTINVGVPCRPIRDRDKNLLRLEKEYESMKKNTNNLKSKFYVGQKVSIKKIVRSDDVKKFAELTGDFNGLHLNDELAKKSIFGNRVCHGMLISSYISAVLGMRLPGEGTIYLSQDLKFIKPVYLNEEIEITVKIEEIVEEKNIMCLSTLVTKADETIVITGNAKVMCGG